MVEALLREIAEDETAHDALPFVLEQLASRGPLGGQALPVEMGEHRDINGVALPPVRTGLACLSKKKS